jgi:hypothetical protein
MPRRSRKGTRRSYGEGGTPTRSTQAFGSGLRKDASVSQFRIVVLASGSGTNLQAILDTLHRREGIEVVGVGTDKPDAWALERAQVEGVATAVFALDKYEDRAARDADMGDWIESRGGGGGGRRPPRPARAHRG